jgi:mRNA-degrading endonuclease RelE of RelBE toxin-antitoxin system
VGNVTSVENLRRKYWSVRSCFRVWGTAIFWGDIGFTPTTVRLLLWPIQLKINPSYHPNIKILRGDLAGYYRYRVGDYRVVYYITEEPEPLVIVTVIAHRSEAYEW